MRRMDNSAAVIIAREKAPKPQLSVIRVLNSDALTTHVDRMLPVS